MSALAVRLRLPSPDEQQLARRAYKRMQDDALHRVPVRIATSTGEPLDLPSDAAQLLLNILDHMARGDAVTLIPVHAELTTQQAADMLNVSRPTLVKFLEEGKLAYQKPGRHRRIKFEEVMRYKRQNEKARADALDELAAIGQDLERE
jgi:excisionase family DNA binding protein